MSLILRELANELDGFPRVSGDEPLRLDAPISDKEFSPRERG